MRTRKRTETEIIASCDPVIRRVVRMLRMRGFETCDSGDGVTKPQLARNLPYPHVFIEVHGQLVEMSHELKRRIESLDITVGTSGTAGPWIEASYDPVTRIRMIVLANVNDAPLPGDIP